MATRLGETDVKYRNVIDIHVRQRPILDYTIRK